MPYQIKKIGNYYQVKNKNTGQINTKKTTKINEHIISYINIILEYDNGSKIDINNHWSITLEFNKVINDNILNIDKSQIKPNITDVNNNDTVGGNPK